MAHSLLPLLRNATRSHVCRDAIIPKIKFTVLVLAYFNSAHVRNSSYWESKPRKYLADDDFAMLIMKRPVAVNR